MASQVFNTHLFPCYSSEYIQSQVGFKGKALWCYSKAYDVASVLNHGLYSVVSTSQYIASGILSIGDYALGWAFNPLIDAIYPINPVNGHRRFVGISRSIEKILGDWVFYPLASSGMAETNELLPGTNERIASKVDTVLGRLVAANGELLNPIDETTQFNYRAKTVLSSEINAFAVPAGGMVVFTQIVKEIDAAIRSQKIKDATIYFADGSKATVDLTNVTLEDALAALMGHEITHVASRHSIASIMGNLIRSALLSVSRILLVVYLKNRDQEYQALTQKSEAQLQEHEKRALANKEQLYSYLNDIFTWIEDQVSKLSGLFHSRKCEYEADVTGTYFAQRANFNSLGAIYLQELLMQSSGEFSNLLHKYLEFIFSHPYGENRKRAIFAAINELDPQALRGRTTWNIADDNGYDLERSSLAVKYAHDLSRSK
jgi:Zn-dependent protease with chaperone function